jgi:hypothetical protein
MPVQGFTRARKHQFARQTTFGTKVPALRAYPKTGVPTVDLTKTDPDVDTGSIVKTVAPYLGTSNITAALTDPALAYDNAPLLMAGVFGGEEDPTGGGTPKTWTHKPSSVDPLDPVDVFTYEFGDDVVDDWFQLGDGILESLTLTGPEGLGPISVSESWRFGSGSSTGSTDFPVDGTVPTPSLDVDTSPVYVYLKDMSIYIADTLAGISGGQITNALHNFVLTITRAVDQKRWADGTQSFDVEAYGVTGYDVALALTFAKTDDTVGTGSEADAWYSEDAVARVIRLKFESLVDIPGGSTPYSWQITMPAWYYTRDDGEVGGNTTVTLTANAYYEPTTFQGFFESIIVCKLTDAELGTGGS